MSLADSSPDGSKFALVSGVTGLINIDTSLSQVVVSVLGIVNSLDLE